MDPITNYLGYAILVTVGFVAGWAVSKIRFAITANKMIKAIDNEVSPAPLSKKPANHTDSKKLNVPKQVLTEEAAQQSNKYKKYRKKNNITTVKYGGKTHAVRIDHCHRVIGPTGRSRWEVKPEFACNYSWLQKTSDSPSH